MRIIRPSNEDEMVLVFLKAEIAVPPYQGSIERALNAQGYTRAIIDNADFKNTGENLARTQCLSCSRGFRRNDWLFKGFPDNVIWQRISLSIEELGRVKYINQDGFVKASGHTRLVSDGARNLDGNTFPEDTISKIKGIEGELRQGHRFPELIVVGISETSSLILVEGHKRATAYMRAAECFPEGVEIIAGLSEGADSWLWH